MNLYKNRKLNEYDLVYRTDKVLGVDETNYLVEAIR